MTRPDVLVVDDDRKTVELVRLYLERADCAVRVAYDGRGALTLVDERAPDLVVLDLMLPRLSGLEVCEALRTQVPWVPIIMLTARTTEDDKLVGLEAGADDYLTKPFSPRELVARVKAIFRRVKPGGDEPIRAGDLVVDSVRHEVRLGARELHLTPREFSLLEILVRHPGRAYSRQTLLEQAFGFDYDGFERTIDVHIGRLRKKIEADPAHPTCIETVPGLGYRLAGHET